MSEKNEKSGAAKNLLELLVSMNRRLSDLERILIRDGQGSTIYQSAKIPTHGLEKNMKFMNGEGFTDETKVPVCSTCHSALGERFSVCHHCDHVVCEKCAIIHNNRAHCEQCLRQFHIDLSKRDYKTLVCLANGITETDRIAEMISIAPEHVERSLAHLSTSNLIIRETKLFGLINERKLTDDGIIALSVYRQFVYGRDEDIMLFGRTLRKHICELKGFRYGLERDRE
jgi:hypothetical protein